MAGTLKPHLVARIKANGPMPVADYMATCLYDPEHGYYMTKNPLGLSGDFITAPDLSQIFGELLGLWVVELWQRMGSPAKATLVEIGPGQGTLAADMLRVIRKAAPQLYGGLTVELIEVSPTLRSVQQNTLAAHEGKITWQNTLPGKPWPAATFVVANELLDAFPVHQYVAEGGKWYERCVDVTGESTLVFNHSSAPAAIPAPAAENGTVYEHHADGLAYLKTLKERLQNGALLLVDYGSATGMMADTLQAQRAHRMENPLENPGLADLTTQVPFDQVMAILGPQAIGPEDMSHFLMALGYAARATALLAKATEAQSQQILGASHRLLDPNQMGRHFKVVGYRTGPWPLAGFTEKGHNHQAQNQ